MKTRPSDLVMRPVLTFSATMFSVMVSWFADPGYLNAHRAGHVDVHGAAQASRTKVMVKSNEICKARAYVSMGMVALPLALRHPPCSC